MNLHNAIFLFFAGALGGAINAVAGGNKLKVILGGVINGVATLTFIATEMILWSQVIVMTVGAILGGYSSTHYAQKLPQAWVRFCHFDGDRHDDLLFHPRLSLEATKECAKHIDFLLSATTFDIVPLLMN